MVGRERSVDRDRRVVRAAGPRGCRSRASLSRYWPVGHDSFVRRPFWFRALITLWGIWFTTALTEPVGLLACPMHSGLGVSAVANMAIGPAAAPMHGHDHAAMAAAGETQSATRGAAPSVAQGVAVQVDATSHHAPTEHHCCTCLGQCCTISPAVVAARVAVPTLFALLASASIGTVFLTRVATRTPHVLPYANGPPLTLL